MSEFTITKKPLRIRAATSIGDSLLKKFATAFVGKEWNGGVGSVLALTPEEQALIPELEAAYKAAGFPFNFIVGKIQ